MPSMTEVARALRGPVDNYETIIPVFASLQIQDATPEYVLGFVQGAIRHQESLSIPDDDKGSSKVFKAKVIDVTRDQRKSNGRVIGEKARLILESTDGSEEILDTHWASFFGEEDPAALSDPSLAWEVALSRSIEEDSRDLIGRNVFVRKAFVKTATRVKGGGDVVRFVADIRGDFRDSKDANKRGRSHSDSSASASLTKSDLKDICADLDIKYVPDFEDLLDVSDWDGSDSAVAARAAKAAHIPKSQVDEFIDVFTSARGSKREKAVLTLSEWI